MQVSSNVVFVHNSETRFGITHVLSTELLGVNRAQFVLWETFLISVLKSSCNEHVTIIEDVSSRNVKLIR